MVSGHHSMIE